MIQGRERGDGGGGGECQNPTSEWCLSTRRRRPTGRAGIGGSRAAMTQPSSRGARRDGGGGRVCHNNRNAGWWNKAGGSSRSNQCGTRYKDRADRDDERATVQNRQAGKPAAVPVANGRRERSHSRPGPTPPAAAGTAGVPWSTTGGASQRAPAEPPPQRGSRRACSGLLAATPGAPLSPPPAVRLVSGSKARAADSSHPLAVAFPATSSASFRMDGREWTLNGDSD